MRCIEGWKFVVERKEVGRVTTFSNVFFENLKCVELFYK
jgi:hypothetical protein